MLQELMPKFAPAVPLTIAGTTVGRRKRAELVEQHAEEARRLAADF